MLLCLPDNDLSAIGVKNEMQAKEGSKSESRKASFSRSSPRRNKNSKVPVEIKIIDKILSINNDMILEEKNINAKIKVVLDIALYRQKRMPGYLDTKTPNKLNLVEYLYRKFEKRYSKKNKRKDSLLIYAVKCQLWDVAINIVEKENEKSKDISKTLKDSFNFSVKHFSSIKRDENLYEKDENLYEKTPSNNKRLQDFIVKLALKYPKELLGVLDQKLQMYLIELLQHSKDLALSTSECEIINIFAGTFQNPDVKQSNKKIVRQALWNWYKTIYLVCNEDHYDGKSRRLDNTKLRSEYGHFCSYIAENARFYEGDKVYYEMTIKGSGSGQAPQIGWVSKKGIIYCGYRDKGYGVGDTRYSWGVDGVRHRIFGMGKDPLRDYYSEDDDD